MQTPTTFLEASTCLSGNVLSPKGTQSGHFSLGFRFHLNNSFRDYTSMIAMEALKILSLSGMHREIFNYPLISAQHGKIHSSRTVGTTL